MEVPDTRLWDFCKFNELVLYLSCWHLRFWQWFVHPVCGRNLFCIHRPQRRQRLLTMRCRDVLCRWVVCRDHVFDRVRVLGRISKPNTLHPSGQFILYRLQHQHCHIMPLGVQYRILPQWQRVLRMPQQLLVHCWLKQPLPQQHPQPCALLFAEPMSLCCRLLWQWLQIRHQPLPHLHHRLLLPRRKF